MKRILLSIIIIVAALSVCGRQPESGYRAFIDSENFLGINIGFLAGEPGESRVATGIVTSHGYQFRPWLYVGGGTGFVYDLGWKDWKNNENNIKWAVPLFAEVRFDGKWFRRFTPYFSARLGANLTEHGGIYCSPMVGYRFNWGRKSAINFGLGASIIGERISYHEHVMLPEGGIVLGDLMHYQGHIVKFTARLGFEFQLP